MFPSIKPRKFMTIDAKLTNKKPHKGGIVKRPLAGILVLLLSLTLSLPVQAVVFTNPATITGSISTGIGTGKPYPSNISVSGLSGTVTKVTVTLNNINHTSPEDLDVLLVAPGGGNILLMSDVGGELDVLNTTIIFDDEAISSLPSNTNLSSGSFKPTNIDASDQFPAPAPAPSDNTTLAAAFNGINPNGTWSLYVVDDSALDMGTIGNGWTLTITTSMTAETSFSNGAAIHSGDSGRSLATTYPSTINVSGLTGAITQVRVTLTNFSALNPDETDILLVGPTGRSIIILSDAGGAAGGSFTLTFDDAAASIAPAASTLVTGSYKPTNHGTADTFPYLLPPYPNPAPAGAATFASVFNGTDPNGTWSLYVVDDGPNAGLSTIQGGWSLDIQANGQFSAQPYAPGDFDADGKTDVALQRSSDNAWVWRESSTYANRASSGFGLAGDLIVPADYDGDRVIDLAIFRPSNGGWYILQSRTNTLRQELWGLSGDVPLPEDYDGDGKTDLAVWRPNADPSQNYFYWRRSSDGMPANVEWGQQGDIPVRGHFEGTNGADFAVYRPSNSTWYILNNAGTSSRAANLGIAGDQLVPSDYDGDGKTDVAVYRPSLGDWYILRSSTGTLSGAHWGASGDLPVPTDYDADGKTDLAVWRPSTGTWYILNSGTPPGAEALRIDNLGRPGDRPLAFAYVPEQ